jgi:tetratricopeptide (TPR) repeat protein
MKAAQAKDLKALLAANNGYWATEVEVQRIAVAAWIAQAKGQHEEAQRLMRGAADMEDRNEKHIVTPGRIAPARELLAEMLLEMKQPAEALVEFEAVMKKEPNRFRATSQAARAADLTGDAAKARLYRTQLLQIAKDGDKPGRAELADARRSLRRP